MFNWVKGHFYHIHSSYVRGTMGLKFTLSWGNLPSICSNISADVQKFRQDHLKRQIQNSINVLHS